MLIKKLSIIFIILFTASCKCYSFNNTSKSEEVKEEATKETQVIISPSPEAKAAAEGRHFVFFTTNSSTLTTEAKNTLNKALPAITATTVNKITIEGYCDERGSADYNNKLAKERAISVEKYLISKGVKADKIKVVSRGESRAADAGHDVDSWARNRRVITSLDWGL